MRTLSRFGPILIAVAALALTGCKTLDDNPNAEAALQIGLTYGVAKYVEQADTPDAQNSRAAKVVEVAKDAKAFVKGDSITLFALEGLVRSKLPPSMSIADRAAINSVISLAMSRLRGLIDEGRLDPAQKLRVEWVLDTVIIAAGGDPTVRSAAKLVPYAQAIPATPDASLLQGQPISSVVVTQCNLIVAVYMTMPNGNLLRFDRSAQVPADNLLALAYTATRSERVEVNCDELAAPGAVGFESHAPI